LFNSCFYALKGLYYRASDFAKMSEEEAISNLFENSGIFSSTDANVALLAGSSVGGGRLIYLLLFWTFFNGSFAAQSIGLHLFEPQSLFKRIGQRIKNCQFSGL
jgi:hypothetical protein